MLMLTRRDWLPKVAVADFWQEIGAGGRPWAAVHVGGGCSAVEPHGPEPRQAGNPASVGSTRYVGNSE